MTHDEEGGPVVDDLRTDDAAFDVGVEGGAGDGAVEDVSCWKGLVG